MSNPAFLDAPPRFIFFTGKGGVGKTSIACATAIHLADEGARVLLVSTDPASNVGQVLGVEVGAHMVDVGHVPNLTALEIDPQAAAQGYRDRIVGPVRGRLPEAVVAGIEEQLSGACTTEIAAFDEFTALLLDSPQTERFDHIVFDTAPTGHTIRMLQLPGAWSSFLEAGRGDASCLGPLAGLEKQRTQYASAVDALRDPARTRMVLVARPEISAIREVERTAHELTGIGVAMPHLVLNGVFPGDGGDDPLAQAIVRRQNAAMADLPATLASAPRAHVYLNENNVVGLDALRSLLAADGAPAGVTCADEPPATDADPLPGLRLADLVDEIAADGHGLVMVMGKGGVGKTTIAAAIAVALAERGLPVHLSTSDPAAHLNQTVADSAAGLEVSRIDPAVETQRYRDHVMATKGADLDAEGRAMLEEDLRSPCTEEIAVFQAFSRIIREAGRRFVVMDTAPTGHTLLLLDATGAYHRDVARNMSATGMHYTTPMMQLQDPRRTKVLIATLAETTPVLEAASLQADLGRAGITPWAWVVNQSLAVTDVRHPLLARRAAHERPIIRDIVEHHATRCALVPMLADPPVGAELTRLTARGPAPLATGTPR